jgi:mannosyl-oligosaccharide glucosidase
LKWSEVTALIEERKSQFDLRFERIYGLKEKGYDSEHIDFAKMLLGNMIGGIGYALILLRVVIFMAPTL